MFGFILAFLLFNLVVAFFTGIILIPVFVTYYFGMVWGSIAAIVVWGLFKIKVTNK